MWSPQPAWIFFKKPTFCGSRAILWEVIAFFDLVSETILYHHINISKNIGFNSEKQSPYLSSHRLYEWAEINNVSPKKRKKLET